MSISDVDVKILWGRAGGICSNPSCRIDLTVLLEERNYHIGEMAHIIAKQPSGNRGVISGGSDNYSNLILLCPTCHTHIDKSPDGFYPVEQLHDWKRQAEEFSRTRLNKPNNPYILFKYTYNLFITKSYVELFKRDPICFYSPSVYNLVNTLLVESHQKSFFLIGLSDKSITLLDLIRRNYNHPNTGWQRILDQSIELILIFGLDFNNSQDKTIINLSRYYSELITHVALERSQNIHIVNFLDSLVALTSHRDETILKILEDITSPRFEQNLSQRISYILHNI
jgi:hypothetical protein